MEQEAGILDITDVPTLPRRDLYPRFQANLEEDDCFLQEAELRFDQDQSEGVALVHGAFLVVVHSAAAPPFARTDHQAARPREPQKPHYCSEARVAEQ